MSRRRRGVCQRCQAAVGGGALCGPCLEELDDANTTQGGSLLCPCQLEECPGYGRLAFGMPHRPVSVDLARGDVGRCSDCLTEYRVTSDGGTLVTTVHSRAPKHWIISDPASLALAEIADGGPVTDAHVFALRTGASIDLAVVDRGELDDLYRLIDDLYDSSPAACDAYLRGINPGATDAYILVALLSATLPYRAQLPHRQALCERVRARLSALASERVDRLLRGLE